MVTEQHPCERRRSSAVAGRISTAGNVGAVAVLALSLFVPPLSAPDARAADLFAKGSNATLVFSPAHIDDGEGALVSVWNTSSVAVQVTFVFTGFSGGAPVPIVSYPATIQAGHIQSRSLSGNPGVLGASVVLNSPVQCSQATEYVGKCGVVASLEVREVLPSEVFGAIHRRVEPVLKPASPGLQPLPIIPQ